MGRTEPKIPQAALHGGTPERKKKLCKPQLVKQRMPCPQQTGTLTPVNLCSAKASGEEGEGSKEQLWLLTPALTFPSAHRGTRCRKQVPGSLRTGQVPLVSQQRGSPPKYSWSLLCTMGHLHISKMPPAAAEETGKH